MVRSSFSILFAIRESKVRKDGTTSIEVVLTVNGERYTFSIGTKIKPIKGRKSSSKQKSEQIE